jgi:integrase
MNKTPAGQPKVRVSNGRLQIVFTYQQQRKYLSLGTSDSKRNRQDAETVRLWIESDITASRFDSTRFDPSLAKYKRRSSNEPEQLPAADITLLELWERFTDYKRPQLSQTTIAKDFERVRLNLAKLPFDRLVDAVAVRDHLVNNTSPNTAKRVLSKLSAACVWGMVSKLVADNPFAGMSADIMLEKNVDEHDIKAFTTDERDRIIQKFIDRGSYYAPLVEFLFRTGCRPSEAIALQVKHIRKDYRSIVFSQAITPSEDGLRLKKKLKTQSQRVFPCGDSLSLFLLSLVEDSPEPDRFLFTSQQGGFVKIDRFSNREWRKVLDELGISPRGLYHCRHTYITFCIRSGMDAADVAKLVGNSAEVIYKHYMSVDRNLVAPGF